MFACLVNLRAMNARLRKSACHVVKAFTGTKENAQNLAQKEDIPTIIQEPVSFVVTRA